MAEEGRAALLPPQRHGADRRAARRRDLVGQGAARNSTAGARPPFKAAGFRAVPNCIVRRSAYIAPGVVLMPSFVNLGAYVDTGTMVDTWATVGSCAQIGKNVHLSGGVGIGGVLEPLQAGPTIIEDNCFIGARSEVVEGVVVGEGSVLAMGVYIGASTKIVDRATGKVHIGHVPPFSVVVSGNLPGKPLPDGSQGPSHLLRRDRQDGRRADALEDRHQRIAARLMPLFGGHSARFLFRSDEGRIGAGVWLRGVLFLAALLAALTAIWIGVAPWGRRDLSQRAFVDPTTIAVYVYLLLYAVAVILIGVSYVNLSLKRLRAAEKPLAISGLLPLAVLLAGAAHWLQPRVADVFPIWIAWAVDAVLAVVAVFSFVVMARGAPREDR
jgi:tetrahydrodipicolinate N-succinyltransferase